MSSSKTRAHTRYKLKEGEIVPGVTTIIDSQLGWNKNVLINWARRQALAGQDPEKIKVEAGDIGTCTHYLVQCHVKGEEPDLGDFTANQIKPAKVGFQAFLGWEQKNKFQYLAVELPVVSEVHRCGGTVDCLAQQDGTLWLLDFKTSNGIWPEHKIQAAAYKHIYNENPLFGEIKEVALLHLGKKDGSFAYIHLSKDLLEWGWDVFLKCRKLYDLKKKFK